MNEETRAALEAMEQQAREAPAWPDAAESMRLLLAELVTWEPNPQVDCGPYAW